MTLCKFQKKSKIGFFVFLIMIVSFTLFAQDEKKTKYETLKYDMDVNVIIEPVFAVNSRGEPVYNLKREDLELFVNGQPVKIEYFKRYGFEYEEKIVEKIDDPICRQKADHPRYSSFSGIHNRIFGSIRPARRSGPDHARYPCHPGDTGQSPGRAGFGQTVLDPVHRLDHQSAERPGQSIDQLRCAGL